MGETLWWAAKYVAVPIIVSGAMAALLGAILESNGETDEEVELDFRDNYRRHHEDRVRD